MNNEVMTSTTEPPLNTKDILLAILEFIPHSKIINLLYVNRFFHQTITGDFKLFYDYTLKMDCGRRGSFLGKPNRGLLDSKGRAVHHKSSEVVISDKHKSITISTSNKPLKSITVRNALFALSKTSINRLYFRRYQISQSSVSAAPSANSSPFDPHTTTHRLNNNNNNQHSPKTLPSIHERGNLNTIRVSTHKSHQLSIISADAISRSLSSQTPDTESYTPSLLTPNTESYDHDSPSLSYKLPSQSESSINSDIMELSLPSSKWGFTTPPIKDGNATHLCINDNQFEELLQILSKASFEALSIGEECVSWTWQTLMRVLHTFNKLQHLAVHINLKTKTMPHITNEKQWLNFIGTYFECVSSLKSISCADDAFLRCIRSLSTHRNLGNNLTFIQSDVLKIETAFDDDDSGMNGHFIRKTANTTKPQLTPLQYIRYQCTLGPDNDFTGIEFDGSQILELSPYDSMVITVPSSVISFRIASGGKFYDEPDEYKIIIPYTNNIRELCLYNIENLKKIRAAYNLKKLEYLVIKKKPKNTEDLKKEIFRLCKYAPIKNVCLLFAKKLHSHHNNDKDHDYYNKKLETFDVTKIKEKMEITSHPMIVRIDESYSAPPDVPNIDDKSRFSDYYHKCKSK